VAADIVCAPPDAELVAASRQLSDEVLQAFMEGVAAGFGPQDRDGDVRR
jgi:hypothetical protein